MHHLVVEESIVGGDRHHLLRARLDDLWVAVADYREGMGGNEQLLFCKQEENREHEEIVFLTREEKQVHKIKYFNCIFCRQVQRVISRGGLLASINLLK